MNTALPPASADVEQSVSSSETADSRSGHSTAVIYCYRALAIAGGVICGILAALFIGLVLGLIGGVC